MSEATAASAQDEKQKILVIDDELINRQLLMHIFENKHVVEMAGDGPTALEMLDDGYFDLILLDIMMPRMSGLDVLKHVRENPKTKNIPVILVTAMSESEDVVNGLRLGANDYITKPVDINVVVARVQTQLTIKQLLDERQQTIGELESAENIRRQLFRIASHDLKNPLNNIRMAEHLLREQVELSKPVKQVLDTIALTVRSMQNIIENFLDMVELQSGELNLKLDYVEMSDVIQNVVTQYEIAAKNKSIAIDVEQAEGVVFADKSRLVQVVSNLISNALKYTPKGKRIRVYSVVQYEVVRLSVEDEGPGIPEHERHLLFEEFTRLSPRPTGGESSTGMGLWIVKHLTESQNGKVGAEFPNSSGSVFWIEFPQSGEA